MPFDQKRNNGPEGSVDYRLYSTSVPKCYEERVKKVIKENGERKGKKKSQAGRKIFIKSGVVSQAKGSAYMELGGTKVIVSVFDPREIPKQSKYSIKGDIFCDFKFSPFASAKRRSPQTDAEEKSLALSMQRALKSAICRHEFPNFQVDIFANVLQDDGCALGTAITCASLALVDAGVPMYDIVTASTVGIIGDVFLLDPTASEEEVCNIASASKEHGVITMARLATHEQISEFHQYGCMSTETIKKANELLAITNSETVPLIREIVVDKIAKCIENKDACTDVVME